MAFTRRLLLNLCWASASVPRPVEAGAAPKPALARLRAPNQKQELRKQRILAGRLMRFHLRAARPLEGARGREEARVGQREKLRGQCKLGAAEREAAPRRHELYTDPRPARC